ncbi:MAG: TonB-dependent receptor [Rariglobus sp.]|jgi:iron complex outermembrane receptor protein|nr:TonB-dependent receptor [Rariglobus sp.]
MTTLRFGLFACLLPIVPYGAFGQNEVASYKKLTLQELMDLEVTSVSRRPEKLSETASAIQVISGEDIRRSGATSIPEALRLASNLQVAQRNSQSWAISARGFNTELSNKLLVLMDGRTVYSPLFSGVYWDAQDYVLEDIDRIEVISGPGGALWGANAVNGVINIRTKTAKETQGIYAETIAGTELENLTSVRYGGMLAPNVYFRIYGKYTDRDSSVLEDGSESATDWNTRRTGFRIDAEPSPQNTFTVQGDIYDNNEGRPGDGSVDLNGGNLLTRWTHTLANDSEMSLQLYYDRTHLGQPVPASIFSPVAGRFTDDLDTYDLDFQHRIFPGERNKVVWGLGYRRTQDEVENAPGLGFLPAELDHDLYSAFIQDEITLGAGWALTLGTKVEHNDYTGFEVEPSGRLQWNFSPTQMVWGAVSRAVRMPSRIDRDLRQPSTGFPIFTGGSGFDSETVIAYELGYRAQLAPNLLVSLSTFYNHYDDLRSLSLSPAPFFFPLYFDNNLEGETYGFELTTTYEVMKGWRLHAGYTLLQEDIRVKSGEVDVINNGLNETADPQNQFSIRSSWDLPGHVELDVGLRWVDSLRINNGGTAATVPSYTEMDLRLAWRPSPALEFSVVGQNLLHDQHPEYGVPGPAREEIERSVYAKVTWRY